MPLQSNLNLGICTSIETYILPYVKEIVSGNLLYDAGSSNPMLWDKGGDICMPMADSC